MSGSSIDTTSSVLPCNNTATGRNSSSSSWTLAGKGILGRAWWRFWSRSGNWLGKREVQSLKERSTNLASEDFLPTLFQFLDTMSSKAVLVLGSFNAARKPIVDVIQKRLFDEGYFPIVPRSFEYSSQPAYAKETLFPYVTETIIPLARLARFIIVDISNQRGGQQLMCVGSTGDIRSTPIQPLLCGGAEPPDIYKKFSENQKNLRLLEIVVYKDEDDLEALFKDSVIASAEKVLRRRSRGWISRVCRRLLEVLSYGFASDPSESSETEPKEIAPSL